MPATMPSALIVLAVITAVTSLITVVLYSIDKHRAVHLGRRIPEVVLHGWCLAGGWVGGLLAQQILRHKTRKVSFQVVFWLIGILQVGAWWVAWHR
jgi:uncharacterized membrane protein YsdA (DUF1294 family)